MPTQLADALEAIITALTATGQPFNTVPFTRDGVEMPAFAGAPPSLRIISRDCCHEHRDLPFLVDGDARLTFGETYSAATCVAESSGAGSRHRRGRSHRHRRTQFGQLDDRLYGHHHGRRLRDLARADFRPERSSPTGSVWPGNALALADEEPLAARLEAHPHSAKLALFGHGNPPPGGLATSGPCLKAPAQPWRCWAKSGRMILPPSYTSGSTGKSKGAWSDHRGVVHGVMSYVAQSAMAKVHIESQEGPMTDQPCALVAVPLFHVTGEVPLFLQSFAIARKLVLMPKWDAGLAIRLMAEEKVSYFVGVPLMSYEIANHPDRDQYDLSACKSFAAGGAPRPVEHVTRIKEAFPGGFPLLGYGLWKPTQWAAAISTRTTSPSPDQPGVPASRWWICVFWTMTATNCRKVRWARSASALSPISAATGRMTKRPQPPLPTMAFPHRRPRLS